MLHRILLFSILMTSLAIAETKTDAKVDPQTREAEVRRRKIAESANAELIDKGKVVKLKLHKVPVYKYHEVERGFHHATTWMWHSGAGRPAVVLNLSGSDALFYEFMSLTNSRVKFDVDKITWAPTQGWNPEPVATKSVPGRTRGARLGQMRAIARKFTAYQVDYEKANKKHHLRLLPEPMYRYAKESDESVDGAMFAFVRNGDLEVILTVEATKNPAGKPKWVFDCDRVATFEQHVMFDKREVWMCPRADFGSSDSDYYVKIVKAKETAAAE